jgi:DNA-binding XRE family transcriptional regulator
MATTWQEDFNTRRLLGPQWYGCVVPDGWRELVERTDELLAFVDPEYKITQVKDKFATMSFYFETTKTGVEKQIMMAIAADAQNRSASICESCGKYGSYRDSRRWVRTLCTLCAAAENITKKSDTVDYGDYEISDDIDGGTGDDDDVEPSTEERRAAQLKLIDLLSRPAVWDDSVGMLHGTDQIGDRLWYLRAINGFTQTDVANRSGIPLFLVKEIEAGETRPSVGTILGLSWAFNLNWDDVFPSIACKPARDPETAPPE